MEPVIYRSNVVKGGQTALMLMSAFGVGMAVMYLLMILGVPSMLIVLAMLGSMALSVMLLIYCGEYILDETGICEKITPYWSPFGWRKYEEHSFTWSQIKAYKLSVDARKNQISFQQTGQKVILEIYFHHTPYKVIFNNGTTPDSRKSFGIFTEAFLSKVEAINMALPQKDTEQSDEHTDRDIPAPLIKRKKSFYEKPIAKLVTLIFLGATITLFYFMIQGYGSATSWFRLLFVLVPGTAYMSYRVFYNPRFDK